MAERYKKYRNIIKNRKICQEVCYTVKVIDAANLDYRTLNQLLRQQEHSYTINRCCGQRFLAAGMSDRDITIYGCPGNALGAYLNNATITVHANVQDAVGDTMNAGKILIYGSIGDAAGYAMRGGKIYIRDDAGYRAGIHMKSYRETFPVMIIGGCAGSFLGEYQAGGIILVLGLHSKKKQIVGNFPCTGMHGGKMILRGDCRELSFPKQVTAKLASKEDLDEIRNYLTEYCADFDYNIEEILSSPFTVITPDSKNPYKQMYAPN